MNQPVITVESLSKIYRAGVRRRRVSAVTDLSFDLEPGSVTAVVGPNGAGKTTTIYAILGLLKPSRGAVSVFGKHPGLPETRERIGYQSEIFASYPFRTAESVMWLYGRLSGMSVEQLRQAVPAQLERVGMKPHAKRRVGTFSKGMTQRLGLAQALLHQPDLLILDEPTTGLDPEGRKTVADIIAEEKARGASVFLSSHILSDIERLSDRVLIMKQGRVIHESGMDSLRQTVRQWDVSVNRLPATLLSRLAEFDCEASESSGGECILTVSAEQKQRLLRVLLETGAPIGTVTPRGSSLEDLYMEYMERPRDD